MCSWLSNNRPYGSISRLSTLAEVGLWMGDHSLHPSFFRVLEGTLNCRSRLSFRRSLAVVTSSQKPESLTTSVTKGYCVITQVTVLWRSDWQSLHVKYWYSAAPGRTDSRPQHSWEKARQMMIDWFIRMMMMINVYDLLLGYLFEVSLIRSFFYW